MSSSVTFAGSVIVDTIKTVDVWPAQGSIAQVRAVRRAIGGCVPNTGIDLARLDETIAVRAFADVGTDENGEFALREMAKGGLDVSEVRRVSAMTTNTDVMTVAETGTRTFFCNRGAGALFDPSDERLDAIDCDIFHLGYILLLDALDAPDGEFGTKAARTPSRRRTLFARF